LRFVIEWVCNYGGYREVIVIELPQR